MELSLEAVHPTAHIEPDRLDSDAVRIVQRLVAHGHQAYLVGGCVRDLLLGHTPKDFDVATSAHPHQVRALFRNSRLIGRRFRLALILFKNKMIEVSTFRATPGVENEAPAEGGEAVADGDANDAAPDADSAVENDLLVTDDNIFGTAEEDARRRDFTVNALFYDVVQGEVVDHVRGLRDLAARRLRTIGDPEVRMREDPVRLLRAARFAARLGFDIESRTYAAMEGAVEDLPRCAAPRLVDNLFRMMRGGASATGLHLLFALDALKFVLPPMDTFLRTRGKAGEADVAAFAGALDARVRQGPPMDDGALLASLFLPLVRGEPLEVDSTGRASVPAIDGYLEDMIRTARLPRRVAERARALLLMQRTLSGERRRRGSPLALKRHPLFEDSLNVFALSVAASGEHADLLEAWRVGAPTFEPRPDDPLPKKRRRRRRRGGPPAGRPGQVADSSDAQTPDDPSHQPNSDRPS